MKKEEQEKLDEILDYINENEEDLYLQKEEEKKCFYNVNISRSERENIQKRSVKNRKYYKCLKEINDIAYEGKIVVNNGMENEECYIGKNAYYSEGFLDEVNPLISKTIIYSHWSLKGDIWRNRKTTDSGYKVLQNRVIDINKGNVSQVYSIFENDLEESRDSFTKDYSDLVNLNKNSVNRTIFSSLSDIQNRFLNDEKGNVILQGVPGSGKTVLGGYKLSKTIYDMSVLGSNKNCMFLTSTDVLLEGSIPYFNNLDMENIEFDTVVKRIKRIMKKVLEMNRGDLKLFERTLDDKEFEFLNNKSFFDNLSGKLNINSRSRDIKEFLNREAGINKKVNSYIIRIIKTYLILLGEINDTYLNKNEKIENHLSKYKENIELITENNYKGVLKVLEGLNESINKEWKGKLKFGQINCAKDLKTSILRSVRLMEKEIEKNVNESIKHNNTMYDSSIDTILIDEAQDITYLELKMLSIYFRGSKFILCGDINQSNGTVKSQDDWDILNQVIDAKLETFNTCFRSSNHVVDTINNFIQNPKYGVATSPIGYEGEGYAITYEDEDRDEVIEYVSSFNKEDTCFIYTHESTLNKYQDILGGFGYKIIHSKTVKGLEFKNVIILDFDEVEKNKYSNKFKYTLISRALDNVIVVSDVNDFIEKLNDSIK